MKEEEEPKQRIVKMTIKAVDMKLPCWIKHDIVKRELRNLFKVDIALILNNKEVKGAISYTIEDIEIEEFK